MNGFYRKFEKFLPWILILLGGSRLLWERFPNRFPFLHILGGTYHGWLFWLSGSCGIVWLLMRASGQQDAAVSGISEGSHPNPPAFFKKYGIELSILLLTAASLSMLIRSGYYWDDAVNSTAYLAQKKDSIPTLRHVLDFMYSYLVLGRINVLSVYYYFLFYIDDVSVYKALIILSILIDQLILRKTLSEFGVPLSGARLGMVLIPLMLQTRVYQDPVSGFYCLMQVLTAEMLLCAMFLMRWLRSGKKRFLALSLLLFAVGLMTYEVSFPFLMMIILLILVREKNIRKTIRDSLPFIGLTLLMLVCVFLVRSRFVTYTTYAGVAFSLDPANILRAALTQLSAGLPLSFYSAGYQAAVLDNVYPAAGFMNYSFSSFLRSVTMYDVLILLGFLAVLFRISKIRETEVGRPDPGLAVIGGSFAVLPMITVALSERYQGQLMPGLGYLPVYMQYYGVAVILLWITLRCRASDGVRAFCLSAFALILLLNLQNNRAVTEIMNRGFYEPRNAGEAALHGGILDFLPEDAMLVSVNDRRYLWEANWNNIGLYQEFYGNNSKHLPGTIGDNRLLRNITDSILMEGSEPDAEGWMPFEAENIWIIDYSGKKDHGFTRLGRLNHAKIDTKSLELRNIETDHVLYFISGIFPEKESVQYTAADGNFRQLQQNEQERIRLSENGILYQLPEDEAIIFNSLTVR